MIWNFPAPKLNCPNLNFFGYNTPIGVIVVGGYNVQVIHIFFDELIQFSFSKNVVVPVERDGSAAVIRRQRFLNLQKKKLFCNLFKKKGDKIILIYLRGRSV